MVGRLKRSVADHQSVNSCREGPKIHHLVIPSSFKHLRSTVVKRPSDGEHIGISTSIGQFLADSKIDDLDALIGLIIENILGLDIPMAYFLGMYEGQSFKHLINNLFELLSIQHALPVPT